MSGYGRLWYDGKARSTANLKYKHAFSGFLRAESHEFNKKRSMYGQLSFAYPGSFVGNTSKPFIKTVAPELKKMD